MFSNQSSLSVRLSASADAARRCECERTRDEFLERASCLECPRVLADVGVLDCPRVLADVGVLDCPPNPRTDGLRSKLISNGRCLSVTLLAATRGALATHPGAC